MPEKRKRKCTLDGVSIWTFITSGLLLQSLKRSKTREFWKLVSSIHFKRPPNVNGSVLGNSCQRKKSCYFQRPLLLLSIDSDTFVLTNSTRLYLGIMLSYFAPPLVTFSLENRGIHRSQPMKKLCRFETSRFWRKDTEKSLSLFPD